ncbi:MAG: HDOD domain-containing protein, partial [Burkholderiales bacterium]|nr:HDOD domain-containing protein [Burkholderiales bacterium]
MSVAPELRALDIDIPAQPQALVQLSLLLAEEDINLLAAASLIETDMALAAAVLKAVNSSLYGLKGRVQSVQQAITYLGMREV